MNPTLLKELHDLYIFKKDSKKLPSYWEDLIGLLTIEGVLPGDVIK